MNGVILDRESLGRDDVDLGPITSLDINWTIHASTLPHQTAERIYNADIVLTNKVALKSKEIKAAIKLKYIGVLATGTNVIDLMAAKHCNIIVSNVTGYGTASVVQHTFALLLSLATNLPRYTNAATNGNWAKSPFFCLLDYPILQLAGRTIGIIGYGELGREVARVARAFGMNVKIASLPGRQYDEPTRTPIEKLLPEVDVLSLHCPLTPETENLIGPSELALMKPSAILINCARGGLVDENALAEALRAQKLGGAGVDVLTEEPPRKNNPLLGPEIPNLLVTPHCAWGARESRQQLINQAGENIAAFLRGEPQNNVIA